MIDYFRIDHERELNPNQESVIEEVREEIAEIKEWILQKQVAQELRTIPLSKKLNRLEDLAYFIGRSDGESYMKRRYSDDK